MLVLFLLWEGYLRRKEAILGIRIRILDSQNFCIIQITARMWAFANHEKGLLISAGGGISHWDKVQG